MIKKFAILFPQFHEVSVNNISWGYGFTDWALVATANAFKFWNTRRAPLCGFYNLSNLKDVKNQFDTAIKSGLDGFGIYHYWFEDGGELQAVEKYLANSALTNSDSTYFKYFFIWANESWSRRWAGEDTNVIKKISASPSDHEIQEHVKYLAPFIKSKEYFKVNDRPILAIYRPEVFSNYLDVINKYRSEFKKYDVDILLGYFIKSNSDSIYSNNFDFCYLFEPRLFFNYMRFGNKKLIFRFYKNLTKLLPYGVVEFISKYSIFLFSKKNTSYSYRKFISYLKSNVRDKFVRDLKCSTQNVISAGWNNSPRYRSNYTELEVPAVQEFCEALSYSSDLNIYSNDYPLLCNAWNEWSEGAAIEPCAYLGDSLLRSFVNKNFPDSKKDAS
ncbi:glycoside hydrolase family 99-like domain-containing protein [Polynucleobacter sp. AP-Nickl1-40-C4]|uniref:glycoside hydrolase family 99-like domain-containing protein n=1 Tax=Polynucleobacter sp. AP-Nickl1-40-C4 TaxID=3108275 RepID=UPI002B228330|nr:glycoside hydrolase family 99-like domain-containing protein [Polynucleobacter sp. AP-Nickl1-40-C4]MEA9568015.1 glycoside hydrolase family 99-like domain-containing protein [Polynucleobacter sp. AP-Nickl1-40-C4]